MVSFFFGMRFLLSFQVDRKYFTVCFLAWVCTCLTLFTPRIFNMLLLKLSQAGGRTWYLLVFIYFLSLSLRPLCYCAIFNMLLISFVILEVLKVKLIVIVKVVEGFSTNTWVEFNL